MVVAPVDLHIGPGRHMAADAIRGIRTGRVPGMGDSGEALGLMALAAD